MKYLILLFLYSFPSHAIFQKVYQGYLDSDHLKQLTIEKSIYEADYDIGLNKHEWQLSLSANNSDSFLTSLYAFQSQQTIVKSLALGLSKSSYRFGSLSFEHSQAEYDISNWTQTNLNSFEDDHVYEGRNKITYAYEFLNDMERLNWDLLQIQNDLNKVSHEKNLQSLHYDFFTTYLSAKARILLDRLYNEAELEAKKRVSMVGRRVRDGLSRRFELKQAELSLLTQEETTIKNMGLLRESIRAIENIIGVEIDPVNYKLVTWSEKSVDNYKYLFYDIKFLDLEQLAKANELNELTISQFEETINHTLNLSLSYTSNAYNIDQGKAISDSHFGNVNDEAVVALTYSLPLGRGRLNSQRAKLLRQKTQNDLKSKNLSSELKTKSEILQENIKRYSSALNIVKKKLAAAEISLKDHKKLYPRGQVSFEELLNAEQALINAKISRTNMLLLYEQSVAQLAFLTGNMVKLLSQYQD